MPKKNKGGTGESVNSANKEREKNIFFKNISKVYTNASDRIKNASSVPVGIVKNRAANLGNFFKPKSQNNNNSTSKPETETEELSPIGIPEKLDPITITVSQNATDIDTKLSNGTFGNIGEITKSDIETGMQTKQKGGKSKKNKTKKKKANRYPKKTNTLGKTRKSRKK